MKRMSDDEIMNFVYGKMFKDLDGIESKSMFDADDGDATEGTAPNAVPESKESGGMKITIEPIMKNAEEGARETDNDTDGDEDNEDDDEDKLKGIGGMSPLMSQLHGKR